MASSKILPFYSKAMLFIQINISVASSDCNKFVKKVISHKVELTVSAECEFALNLALVISGGV